MSISKTMTFLVGELARHGSDLVSMADLSSIGLIEAELEAAAVTDETARAVAWIAAVVPGADRAAVRQAFNEGVEDLLERLVPLRLLQEPRTFLGCHGLGRRSLWAAWAQATQNGDPIARAVATALLSAERAKISNADDAEHLRQVLEIAIRNSSHPETRERLTAIRDALASIGGAPAGEVPTRRPRMISLSIDVVGSTAAKAMLRDLAADEARRDQRYTEYYRNFLWEEGRFYDALFAAGAWGFGPPLDWRKLFVVKGIGDELWLTYDVSDVSEDHETADAEIGRATVRLVGAALGLVARMVDVGGLEHDTGPTFNPDVEETMRYARKALPFKVTMDLIEDAIEISDMRMEFLTPRVGAYLAAGQREPGSPVRPGPFGAEDVEILNRLNAGSFALVGGHRLRQVYRSDLIGTDVDRFFRITKEALPGCVMIGDALFSRLSTAPYGVIAADLEQVELLYAPDLNRPTSKVRSGQPVLVKTTTIPEKELKGIGRSYVVRHGTVSLTRR
jgi:hypothetical protein